ncbi:MAG: glutamine synthetase III [Clostridia bacterium]|nr:glutamine synthetase III [Clostridia bacterium]
MDAVKNMVPEYFGSNVFDDMTMRARLPKETYKAMIRTIRDGRSLDLTVANVVANAMKDWAIERGATHYTHWFQPMTGITAEKHDSFISPDETGRIIMEFSGKELVQGEPDASSFPSGGLRATCEARGYTAWDPTSYAFVKENVLCIPTAFCSFAGDALDKKTPLLRSMEALNRQAMRIIKLFGNEGVTSIKTTVGPEQEYFLIDREIYNKRPDLIFTGRTLFGSRAPKGQELDDHYFGTIKPRVAAFMKELDEELWKLGVYAKTEHNEGAPSQHELAPIFTTTNIAADHNQLTMELMQKLAKKHGMVCLLHEKPFAGVAGSGKHNNWSMSTNTGINLLNPGETPYENAQFLLYLCAVIKAVDEYQDLLRISVASAGNDHRLGAAEAPPAIVSMSLGDELTAILSALEKETAYSAQEKSLMRIGVHVLPKFPRDTTDRNRTSPFAFTGNKFEFRMLGSSESISDCNTVINTAVAESLSQFANVLEKASNFESVLHDLIVQTIRKHKRIIFNGNGYDEAWVKEAEKRGLLNLRSTPDAIPYLIADKNIELFRKHKVFTERELRARYEIYLETYSKVLNIEARTMVDMLYKDILPAISGYGKQLSDAIIQKKKALGDLPCLYETETLSTLSSLTDSIYRGVRELERAIADAKHNKDNFARAKAFEQDVLPKMKAIRSEVDRAERITSLDAWPYPTYADMLFGVRG